MEDDGIEVEFIGGPHDSMKTRMRFGGKAVFMDEPRPGSWFTKDRSIYMWEARTDGSWCLRYVGGSVYVS